VEADVMKLSVDADVCMGHGRCYRLAPELLSDDDEGFVTIRGQTIEVPNDLRDLAEELEATCPEGAISLSED
jgi:ferredoxin